MLNNAGMQGAHNASDRVKPGRVVVHDTSIQRKGFSIPGVVRSRPSPSSDRTPALDRLAGNGEDHPLTRIRRSLNRAPI